MSPHTIWNKLKKDAITALLQLSSIFWETIVSLFLAYSILLSHKILQEYLANSKIIQLAVALLHLSLILRVMIIYFKNIYNQIKGFMNNKKKVNEEVSMNFKNLKVLVYKSEVLARKGNTTRSHKVSNRRISKPKGSPDRK